jgi:protein-disulfide isomerase
VGIDRAKFDAALDSGKFAAQVERDMRDAERVGVNSTPTFFVNGIRHKGPWDAANLIRALEAGR